MGSGKRKKKRKESKRERERERERERKRERERESETLTTSKGVERNCPHAEQTEAVRSLHQSDDLSSDEEEREGDDVAKRWESVWRMGL